MEKEDKKMFESFCRKIMKAEQNNITFSIELRPNDLAALHGAVVLAMKHPQVQEESKQAYKILQAIRERLLYGFVKLQFTKEEIKYLDTKEV